VRFCPSNVLIFLNRRDLRIVLSWVWGFDRARRAVWFRGMRAFGGLRVWWLEGRMARLVEGQTCLRGLPNKKVCVRVVYIEAKPGW